MKAYDIVAAFEDRVAARFGAKHGVAVDCCTHAIFLSIKYWQAVDYHETGSASTHAVVPARTYVSVPFALMHAGLTPLFEDYDWAAQGYYPLVPFLVYDAAKAWRTLPGNLRSTPLYCLSFHAKKHIPIGRGGMVITDDSDAAAWLRRARYDGRDGVPFDQERISAVGYHMYLTPEQAARGLHLMDLYPNGVEIQSEVYPDLREMPVFKGCK